MKVVVNRGAGCFHLPEETILLLIKKGWKVTECDKETYQPIDITADIVHTTGGIYCLNNKKIFAMESSPEFRTHKDFVDIVENKLSKDLAKEYILLEIVDIPDDVEFYISSEDPEGGGCERIHEKHRIW